MNRLQTGEMIIQRKTISETTTSYERYTNNTVDIFLRQSCGTIMSNDRVNGNNKIGDGGKSLGK